MNLLALAKKQPCLLCTHKNTMNLLALAKKQPCLLCTHKKALNLREICQEAMYSGFPLGFPCQVPAEGQIAAEAPGDHGRSPQVPHQRVHRARGARSAIHDDSAPGRLKPWSQLFSGPDSFPFCLVAAPLKWSSQRRVPFLSRVTEQLSGRALVSSLG